MSTEHGRIRSWVLRSIIRAIGVHDTRLDRLETRMGMLDDVLRTYAQEWDAETTRIGMVLAGLQAQLNSGESGAAARVSASLDPLITRLKSMGTGTSEDPMPAPPTPGDAGGPQPAGG